MKYLLIFLLLIVFGCEPKTNDAKTAKDKKDGIVKTYSKDGKLMSELNYKNGLREGLGKSFYKSGNLQFLIPYSAGKRYFTV